MGETLTGQEDVKLGRESEKAEGKEVPLEDDAEEREEEDEESSRFEVRASS